jgi:probable rRNA maturation factor
VTSTKVSPLQVRVTSPAGRTPVAARQLEALACVALAAEHIEKANVSVTLVSSRAMAALNKEHLGHSGPTDVITFALGTDVNGVLLADIYICVEVAREQAAAHKVALREEVQRLVVHGVLHACGYDHPTDDSRTNSPMWKRQELLLKRFLRATAEGA